jgi:signal transduction histidine kinase
MSVKTTTSTVILNVNDHEPTRYLVTRLLTTAGFRVIEAATGAEALSLALQGPDLVVLDIKLPDMSGLDVCRLLKSRPETASLLVLQTSATFVSAERRVAGLESGADGYLAHPFEPTELIATVNSLMRLKAAEDALRQRAQLLAEENEKKDQFLSMLAHELRNPLAGITTATDLLEHVHSDRTRFLRTRDLLRRQSTHLRRLVDDLLDVSRVTQNRIELRRERCDIESILRDALSAHAEAIAGRDQRVTQSLTGELVVLGDRTRVHQIFSNLIDNASKYGRAGGSISITAQVRGESDRRVVVSVADDGIGMTPEFLPRAFDLFVQADTSIDRSSGGLGVGLTLVKRLVQLHGGEIAARSDGKGQGSVFEVSFPWYATAPSPVASPAAASAAAVNAEAAWEHSPAAAR